MDRGYGSQRQGHGGSRLQVIYELENTGDDQEIPFGATRAILRWPWLSSRRESSGQARGPVLAISTVLRNVFACILSLGAMFGLTAHAQQGAEGDAKPDNVAATMFASDCAVCHGGDGRGGERAPNIATKRETVNLSDAQLTAILKKGVLASGMPAFGALGDEKIMQLVSYLRELQGMGDSGQARLTGDAGEGEKTFFDNCSRCHMIHGKGGFLGEDLSTYARGRSAEAIRAAILHPEDSPGGADHIVDIQTTEAGSFRGLIRARDNFTFVLQDEDGGYHSIARNRIQKMIINTQPLMPQDYGTKLDDKSLSNLIRYLQESARSGNPAPKTGQEDVDD